MILIYLQNFLKKYFKGDGVIWMLFIVLQIWSIYVVSYTTVPLQKKMGLDQDYYVAKVTILAFLSFSAAWLTHHLKLSIITKWLKIILWISIPLLIYTWLKGATINEASRWLLIPYLNIVIQPSCIAVIALIVVISHNTNQRFNSINDFQKSIIPNAIWVSVICGLIAFTNVSYAVIVYFTFLVILYLSRYPIKYVALLSILSVVAGIVAIVFGQRGQTAISRIENFLYDELSYQSYISNQAITSGGAFGAEKIQLIQYLPHPYSDFVFASIIEIHGWLGAIIAIICIFTIIYKTLRIGASPKGFNPIAGIAILFMLMAISNMLVVTGILPLFGIDLPFLGMGGSNKVFVEGLGIGIIQSGIKEHQSHLDTQSPVGLI
jgi:cell division protein FtsW